jgi:hypothetical protein
MSMEYTCWNRLANINSYQKPLPPNYNSGVRERCANMEEGGLKVKPNGVG